MSVVVVWAIAAVSTAQAATWQVQPAPPVDRGTTALTSVSCSAASACTAVGYHQPSIGTGQTVAMRWNGTAWTTQATLRMTGYSTVLRGVSCVSTSFCMAVGTRNDSSGQVAITG